MEAYGGRGGCRGSAMVPFERAMVVSYRLSFVTVAPSLTIRGNFPLTYSDTISEFLPFSMFVIVTLVLNRAL